MSSVALTKTEARWVARSRDPQPRFDWAVRPLWVSVGGLMALGLMGVGVLAPGHALRSDSGSEPPSAAPVHTCYGVPCAAGPVRVDVSMYAAFKP
jgi:hypothetical protein